MHFGPSSPISVTEKNVTNVEKSQQNAKQLKIAKS